MHFFFSKWLKLLLLFLLGLLWCSFIVFIVPLPVASWDRKIRSADRIFNLKIVIWSADRIFDLEVVIQSRDSNSICRSNIRSRDSNFIFEIVIRSADWISDLEILIRSADTLCLILNIKQMAPLGFGKPMQSWPAVSVKCRDQDFA